MLCIYFVFRLFCKSISPITMLHMYASMINAVVFDVSTPYSWRRFCTAASLWHCGRARRALSVILLCTPHPRPPRRPWQMAAARATAQLAAAAADRRFIWQWRVQRPRLPSLQQPWPRRPCRLRSAPTAVGERRWRPVSSCCVRAVATRNARSAQRRVRWVMCGYE